MRALFSTRMIARCILVAAGALALGVLDLRTGAFPSASASRAARPDKRMLRFRRDEKGRDARIDAEWRIAIGSGQTMGLIVSAAVCGDEAFLLDRRLGTVHRIDLAGGVVAGRFGGTSAADRLTTPTGLAADCDARRVYVVESSGTVVFDADSGGVFARFARPATFVNSIGPAILDPDSRSLFAPGLWTPKHSDWLIKPASRMFEGDGLGYQLDLTTGATSAMVPAVERGCWSIGPNCLYATLDRVSHSSTAGWIAAHRVGAVVGVFDAAFRPVTAIDVRSPMFLELGDQNGAAATSPSSSIEEMVAWNEENSVIRGLYSFGRVVATVHSYNRTRGWRPGQQTDFEVFMNLHSLEGVGLASDIRLPGLPVGRDDTSLYVIDYGQPGRRGLGRDPVTLLRIPVTAAVQ